METILRAEKLSKDEILKDISFSIHLGEMAAIMGPSGSGKSTLLYNVSGMDQPTGGKVWLKEQEITALSEDEKATLRLHRIGFVFQQMNMMENLNILDNILLPALQANKERKSGRGITSGGSGRREKRELVEEAMNLMKKLSISGLEQREEKVNRWLAEMEW